MFNQLGRQGLTLVSCRTATQTSLLPTRPPALDEQIVLCRHLAALVVAGIPAHQALEDMASSLPPSKLRQATRGLLERLLRGESLSRAAAAESGFDPLFPLLLRAGEATGKLAQALGHLEEALSWKLQATRKLRDTLGYPLVQLVLAGTAVIVLMTVAVPQIISLFDITGQTLPWYSSVLLFVMKLIGIFLALALGGGLLAALTLPALRIASPEAALKLDRLGLALPVIGPLATRLQLARLTQLFSAMLASGVGLPEILATLPKLTRNKAIAADLGVIGEAVGRGKTLAQAFGTGLSIPAYMARLIRIGEDGDALATSLRHISLIYQQESHRQLEALMRIMSLFMTVTVGLALAAMVLGVFYPLYSGLSHMVGA